MRHSRRLWEKIKAGEFNVVISDVVINEIIRCKDTKRNILLGYLDEIEYDVAEAGGNEKSLEIAGHFVNLGILKQTSFEDCQHIAAAIISGCDAIISWNFKHIVNYRTINGVEIITAKEGYPNLLICTPQMLIGDDEDDT